MNDADFYSLTHRVEQLIALCEKLHSENTMLKIANSRLCEERDTLHTKNDVSCTTIEVMLERLKEVEPHE